MKRQIYHLLRKLELNPGLAGFAFLAFAIFLTISTDKTAPPHAENNIYQHIARQFNTSTYHAKRHLQRAANTIQKNNPSFFAETPSRLSGKQPSAHELIGFLAKSLTEDDKPPMH